jgi:hypothetical protein
MLEHGVVQEPVSVRLSLAAALMLYQAALLQLGHVPLHLASGFTEFQGHSLEGIPECAVLTAPTDAALVESLLAVGQIRLAAHDVGGVEATDLAYRIEGLSD